MLMNTKNLTINFGQTDFGVRAHHYLVSGSILEESGKEIQSISITLRRETSAHSLSAISPQSFPPPTNLIRSF